MSTVVENYKKSLIWIFAPKLDIFSIMIFGAKIQITGSENYYTFTTVLKKKKKNRKLQPKKNFPPLIFYILCKIIVKLFCLTFTSFWSLRMSKVVENYQASLLWIFALKLARFSTLIFGAKIQIKKLLASLAQSCKNEIFWVIFNHCGKPFMHM